MATKTKTKTDETAALLPLPTSIKLVDGETFEIPVMSFGREIQMLDVVKEIVITLASAGVFDEANTLSNIDVAKLVLEVGPPQLRRAAAAITGQDEEWVDDNLTITSVLEVVVPFLQAKSGDIASAMLPFLAGNK